MKTLNFCQNVVLTTLLFFLCVTIHAQQNRTPDRGFKANASYSISNIENVNMSNGNLLLNIPIASLPSGRGSSPGFTVSLVYNSKLWDSQMERRTDGLGEGIEGLYYTRELVKQSNSGGWFVDAGTGYQLILSDRRDLESDAPCTVSAGEDAYRRNGYAYKLTLQLPDGNTRTFRPYGTDAAYSEYAGVPDGYFSLDPWGTRHTYSYSPPTPLSENPTCSNFTQQITTTGINYYTDDGSELRLSLPYQPGVGVDAMRWTLYMPDGRIIENKPADDTSIFQRATDQNGNKLVWRSATVNGYSGMKIEDDVGRYIFVGDNKIIQPGVGGQQLETTLQWGSKWVYRHYRATEAANANYSFLYADLAQQITTLTRITLPSQAGGQEFNFTYNGSDTSPPVGNYTYGWGELKSITLPSGAAANYSYSLDGDSNTELKSFDVLANTVIGRQLNYQAQYDGQTSPIVESTSYSISVGNGASGSCGPDGKCSYEVSAVGGNVNGYAYRISQTGGSVVEKIWVARRPTGDGAYYKIDPIVKTEFTSIPDAGGNPVLTAIKDYDYDQNGNVLEVREYDWVPYNSVPRSTTGDVDEFLPVARATGLPTGLVLKRRTTNTYYYSTPNTLDAGQNTSYQFANPASPRLRHLIKSSEVKDVNGTTASRTEYYYDGGTASPVYGNLTETHTWDSTRGGVTNPLIVGTNAIATTAQYDQYGNAVQTSDANNIVTQITYGSVGGFYSLYPTQTVTAAGTSVARTSRADYDFYTGSVTSATDVENNATTTTSYDALGRPVSASNPIGATTSTTYYDAQRFVVTRSDLESSGDGKKVVTTFYDQLGRVRLTKTLEDASIQSPTNETDGIKVQTRYLTANPYSYQATSSPYRADYSYNAGGETTMGWSLATSTNTGLHSQVQTFSSAGVPIPLGGGGSSTGTVQTDVDANTTIANNQPGAASTVTDQAGKQRRSITDVLGRLIRVDEPTSNGLGSIGSPNQPTYYSYDTLGNMIRAQQGVQNRYFLYSSLGRMLRVFQPEQEANTSLSLGGNPYTTSWTAGFTYDNNGNVLTTTDAKNTRITSSYDPLNRATSRAYTDGTPPVSLGYDGYGIYPTAQDSKGKLTSVSNGISETRYTNFDAAGRLRESKQITDGQTYTSSYQYNVSGALEQETYPSSRVVKNQYEPSGDISRVFGQPNSSASEQTYADSFSYLPDGKIEKLKIGNGLWESAKVNPRGQVTELALGYSASDGSLMKINYEYGVLDYYGTSVDTTQNSGNIARQTLSFSGVTNPFVQTYRYDSLDRIKEAIEKVNGNQTWKQTFGFDQYGNRTSFYQIVGAQQLTINNLTLPSIDANTNRFALYQGYSYDKNGNITADPASNGRTFVFDGNNKQTQVRNSTNVVIGTYSYDGNGKRVKKVTNLETTVFVYDGMGKLIAEYSNAAPPANPTINYTATDQLGSPRVLTDKYGSVISRRDFMPFGEELYADGTYRTISSKYSQTGQDAVRKRFTGYERDLETGLDFAEARYYNNQHGRFTAVDPLLSSGKSANPQTFNRYVYVMDRPLLMADAKGLQAGATKDDGILGCTAYCNASYDKSTNTITGRSGSLIDEAVNGTIDGIARFAQLGIQKLIDAVNLGGTPDDTSKVLGNKGFTARQFFDTSNEYMGQVADLNLNAISAVDPTGQASLASTTFKWQNGGASNLNMAVALLGAGSAPLLLGEGQGTRLFRGVPKSEWPEFADALEGIARPIGGHSDPALHNEFDTYSIFTSWTTKRSVARGFARFEGVVLECTLPPCRLVKSPDKNKEFEVLVTGTVEGAKVHIMPKSPY